MLRRLRPNRKAGTTNAPTQREVAPRTPSRSKSLGANLGPKKRANLKALADARGETPEETANHIATNLLRTIPRNMVGYADVDFHELDVEECGISHGYPWLRTTSGRTFYEHPATARDVLMYVLLRDRVPAIYGPDTLVVANHVIRRYLHGAEAVPTKAHVAVDAGAYTGLKPIAYADLVGEDGHVVAIEMMPDNFELMDRNVEVNGLRDRVSTVHCALSDRPGTVMTRRLRKQQATIAEGIEQFQGFGEECEVPMDTLANIFDRTVPGRDVDFLNIQVNGSEVEVLEGLGPWADRVGNFLVSCLYSRDGSQLRDQVIDWFGDHHIEVTHVLEKSVVAQRVDR